MTTPRRRFTRDELEGFRNTTVADLEGHVTWTRDADKQAVLAEVLDRLKSLL